MNLIFNGNKPKYTPDLKDLGKYEPIPEQLRREVMAEIELLDTASNWSLEGDLEEAYKDLAMVYTSAYSDKLRQSSLLLTFQSAIVKMEVDRKIFVEKKGETEGSEDLKRRNQLFMTIHKEFSAQLEKNQQMVIMVSHARDKLIYYDKKVRELEAKLKAVEEAENF